MSIEREFIKELLTEIENVENQERIIKEKEDMYQEVVDENKALRKEIDHLKTEVKKPYTRTTITNPTTMNIFEAMKEGDVITFIKPTDNKSYTIFKENPFIFQLENKGAIYCKELLGMYEIKGGNIHYYYQNKPGRIIGGEIARQILHIDKDTMECSFKTIGSRKGKKVSEFTYIKILKMNPVINLIRNKFVSCNGNKFIYTKNDGSKYILLENGEEEVV